METWSTSLHFAAIAREHGTPLFVFAPARLLEVFADYAALVGAPSRVAYPIKANPTLPVLRTLAAAGAGADCASAAEVELALLSGFAGDGIFYNTPAAEPSTVRTVLTVGGTVVANSAASLRAISRVRRGEDLPGRVFLRWNPDTTSDTRARYTAHGSAASQFGMADDELLDAVRSAGVPVSGVHTHIGSRQTDLPLFTEMIVRLHRIVDEANRAGGRITGVNLGGGLACATSRTDDVPTVAEFAGAVRPYLRPDLTYYVEPGNSLVGDCIGVLTSLTEVRRAATRTLAIANIGSDQLLKVSVLGKPHDVLNERHEPLPRTGGDTLFGPLNFIGDVLLPSTSLDDAKTGDVLFVQHCGAYCQALGNHFNGRLAPAMVLARPDGAVEPCTTAEPAWLDVTRTTYLWHTDSRPYPDPVVYQPDGLVGSDLWTRIQRLSDNTVEFELSATGRSQQAFTVCEAAVAATVTCRDPRATAQRVVKVALEVREANAETAPGRVHVSIGPPVAGVSLFRASCPGWFDARGEAAWRTG